MNATAADWALLGIAPTEDVRAIRVAYARELKAIDPESDPQAFIKLRSAYERATGAASGPATALLTSEIASLAFAETPVDTTAAPEEDSTEQHARAILVLLGGDDPDRLWLDASDREALVSHWQALVTDPRMELLDHADRVERWSAAVIAETSSRSAPILMLAVERFGWADGDQNVHSGPYIFDIARRYRLLQLLQAASQPGSRHHPAWLELHKPSDDLSYSRPIHPYLMFELIAAMRYAQPQLVEVFDPGRLETWELHAEDARTVDERPERETLPSGIACGLTLVILFAFALGLVLFLDWFNGQ